MLHKLSLVLPIFDEAANIPNLFAALEDSRAVDGSCPHEVILVNNGSKDDSLAILKTAFQKAPWARIVSLETNQGYGGGVRYGLSQVGPDATHAGWLPADLQYRMEDLRSIWKETSLHPKAVHKGCRTIRSDSRQTQLVSFAYTSLVKILFDLAIEDANGLPKIFPRDLLPDLQRISSVNFVFDVEALLTAAWKNVAIIEHPVVFLARRGGVSSWSSSRMRVYRQTLIDLMRLKRPPTEGSKRK